MQHKIWNKMFILILGWLMISFFVFFLLFFTTPLGDLISAHAWIMFIVVDYFLFVINLFVLSIVHIIVDTSMKFEKKILITWASSSLLVAIILFLLPSYDIEESHYVEPKHIINNDFYHGHYMVIFQAEPDVTYYYGITKKGKLVKQFCEKDKLSSDGVTDIVETETKYSEKKCGNSLDNRN